MKKMIYLALMATCIGTAQAQTEEEIEYEVVLPEAAQKCVLPAAPDSIPPQATYEQLIAAKGQVADFQAQVTEYRACLDAAGASEGITPGNEAALAQSHNYSVDMEERVATRFNDAVREYKESKGESTAEE